MKVWIFEDNLMWSARLVQSLTALGHEPVVLSEIPDAEAAHVAILNLGASTFATLVTLLRENGVYTIGHAGHKEKDLLELGREAGCDKIATNSELTFKIEALIARKND